MVKIRTAEFGDAAGLAQIQVNGWRSAFKGIVPQPYLDSLNYTEREERWRQIITEPGDRFHVFVSTEDERVTGFSCGGKNRSDVQGYDGELWAIFVDAQTQRKGVGRALFGKVYQHLRLDGFEKMLLWCLKENFRSLDFYRSLGGLELHERMTDIGGTLLPEAGFGWDLSRDFCY